MRAEGRILLAGLGAYVVPAGVASVLWRSYEALPRTLWIVVLFVPLAALAIGFLWRRSEPDAAPSRGAFEIELAALSLAVFLALAGILGLGRFMPVEPLTFGFFFVIASPAGLAGIFVGAKLARPAKLKPRVQ